MAISILLPLLVCSVGVLVYALSSNGKVAEMGRMAYGCGLLVTLFELAGHVLRL